MSLNRWQRFWMNLDQARAVVRLMVFAKFAALVYYVFLVTNGFFGIVSAAMGKDDPGWAQLVPILAAVTAFAGITIPILASIYKEVWQDYRQSGTNWKDLSESNWDNRP